jgi:hypothetical protein
MGGVQIVLWVITIGLLASGSYLLHFAIRRRMAGDRTDLPVEIGVIGIVLFLAGCAALSAIHIHF